MSKILDTPLSRSFPEQSATATIGSLVVAFGGYALAVAFWAEASTNDYKALMVLAVVVFAALMAISHALLAARAPRAAGELDERDRAIAQSSGRIAAYVLAVGVFAALVLALFEASYFAIANTLLGAWVAAELVDQGAKLARYRSAH